MRLISQDGMIDVPYENTIINCVKNNGGSYTIHAETCSHCFGMAVYTTKSKAVKAMALMRGQYIAFEIMHICRRKLACFKFPKDEDVEV